MSEAKEVYDDIWKMIEGMEPEEAITSLLNVLGDIVIAGEPDTQTMGHRISAIIESLCRAVPMKSGVKISAQSELHEVQ